MARRILIVCLLVAAGCRAPSADEPTAAAAGALGVATLPPVVADETTPAGSTLPAEPSATSATTAMTATTATSTTTDPATRSTHATTATATATTTATTTTATTTSTSTTSTTTTSTSTTSTSTTTTTEPPPPMASCDRVAHIGDSTSVYLWEAQYVSGDAANTMGARYRSVGVVDVVNDSNGGRSIVERIADWQTNALEVATAIRNNGFDGCWVIMIGTNDAANVAAGAGTGIEERINRVLYAIGDQPVLWVDAVTTGVSSAYRNSSMQAWNDVLYRIAAERENVAVVPWSQLVRPEWFQSDGIHYNQEGRAWRAAITALALAQSFPR